MLELKQSTEIKVRIGSAVDATDGVTPETGLTLGSADQAELLKHNGAATVDISGRTFAAITGADGWYDLTLTTTDTNTLGQLTVVVQDSSLMAPIFCEFMVTTANYWDSKYSTDVLQVDLVQMGGVVQSATDLKDFADDGYNPSTNKITGVLLTDTCTTNTDLVSAAAVVNEWETQSQADPTGFHVNVLEVGGTSQTANDNGADINSILTDTGTTLPGTLTTIEGKIDIVDGNVDGILVDTAEIGAAGAGLTDLGGMSTGMKAEINTEADSAISDYDPPTKAEMDARTIPSADYIVTSDTIAGVTTVTNLTNAPTSGDLTATMKTSVNTEVVDVLTVDTIADSYATDGNQPTIAQALLAIQQMMQEKSITGTTLTVKKPDGSTSAMTFTLDSATTPTSITRST